nr:polymorphic toxin type 47 domain-containing protein [Aeribacillus composti]
MFRTLVIKLGKRGGGGAIRGHILVDDVPVNR